MAQETISKLIIDFDEDTGSFSLTQDFGGNESMVFLDTPHVRRIAELAGFSSTQPDDKAVRTLRALRRLTQRVVEFRDSFAEYADFDHADLLTEMTTLNSLRDLCLDSLEDLGQHDLVDFLNESEPVQAPTTPPNAQKPAVAVPDKPAPRCAKADAVGAAILKIIEGQPSWHNAPGTAHRAVWTARPDQDL